MKTIAVIPARGGSKRLPNKNLLLLGGIPLIAHSIIYAQANRQIIDEIFVSTDDERIKAVSLEYGVKVIDRPAALSGDHEPTVSAVRHALEVCPETIQNIVLLQPTNPLRPEALLNECMHAYIQANADSLFTVTKNAHKLGRIDNNKFIPFNYEPGQRSQDIEQLYSENGLLYIVSRETILNNYIISENAIPFEVHHQFASVDIDTAEDFEYAAYLYEKFKTQNLT